MQALLQAPYTMHWCTRYGKHAAPARVQAILQAPGPSFGAGGIAGTWPRRGCTPYCSHPAPVLVQALLQAPGPGVGARVVAGNLHAAMMVKLLVHVPTFYATKMVAGTACRLLQGYMHVPTNEYASTSTCMLPF